MFGWRRWSEFLREVDGGGGGGESTAAGSEASADATLGGGNEGGGEGFNMEAAFSAFRDDVMSRLDAVGGGDEYDDEDEDDDYLPVEDEEETQAPQRQQSARTGIFDPRNFSDEDFDDEGNLTLEAQERALGELVQRQVAEALAPDRARAAAERITQEADALEEKYPILADPEKRAPVLRAAQQRANAMARATGNPSLRDLWRQPAFIETTLLASIGEQAASAAGAAGEPGRSVTLESGGSAGPSSTQGDGGKAIAQGIVGLARKEKFRLGS